MPDLRIPRTSETIPAVVRPVVPADVASIEGFLAARPASSMFLRSYLHLGGLAFAGGPYQGTWVGAFDPAVVGVAMHAWTGNVILQAPTHAAPLARSALAESGRALKGILGPWAQVTAAREAVGLAAPPRLNNREDLFELQLADLLVPEPRDGVIFRVATSADLDRMVAWRCDAMVLSEGAARGPALEADVRPHIERYVREGTMFLVEDRGPPVACSTFNARMPDCVQIGGVWTPPALRGRGYARRVVAGSLVAARARGVTRSVLFTGAHNEPARRAYLALGYRIVGDYALLLW